MRRKSEEKKGRIAEAGVRVFARDGFHGAMISRIAEEAGVATGSVYLYFDGKEDLLQHLFADLWQRLHVMFEAVVRSRDLGAGEKIEALIDGVYGVFEHDPQLAQVFVQEQHHLVRAGSGTFLPFYEEFLQMGEQVFSEGIGSGAFKEDLDPLLATHAVFGALRQLLQQWARAPGAFPLENLPIQLKSIVMRGVIA